ncbi:MAG: single-stranded DNA-binding protein [Lachnospiraceae bacterium]|nr:single-stranded DNA-binding protein [Lachnospiraceae bacterium]
MNKVIMMGRLTRDPEIRYSQGANATTIARFTIAVDRRFKREGEPEADFFNCVAFGKTGDFLEKWFHQGNKILITGRVENDNYTNKDGQKVYGTRISVEEAEFGESKGNSSTQEEKPQNTPKSEARKDKDGFMNIPDGIDEELPFN